MNPVNSRVKWNCAPLPAVAPGNSDRSSRSMPPVPAAKAPVLSGNVPVYDQKLISRPSSHECTYGNPIGNDAVANHASGGTSAVFKSAALAMSPPGKQSLLPVSDRHTTIACGPFPVDPAGTVISAARLGAVSSGEPGGFVVH